MNPRRPTPSGPQPESEEFLGAVEEIADAAVNEWLRQDVVEGPPPDAYALLVEAVAKSNRLVIDDTEVEKMAGEVAPETDKEARSEERSSEL